MRWPRSIRWSDSSSRSRSRSPGAGYWAFVGGLAAGAARLRAGSVWRSPYKLRLRWRPGALRELWSFSGPLLVGGGAVFVMAWSAVIAAKLDLGVAAVGVIALADNISSFTDRVDQLVTGALYPAICAVRDRTALLYESLVKSNRLALMWAVPFGVGVTLFCSDLVRFGIGERWRPAVVVLQVYGSWPPINHVGFNWTAYFRALGPDAPDRRRDRGRCVAFLAAGIPLLLVLGLPGFAIGIAVQAMVALVLRAYYLQRCSRASTSSATRPGRFCPPFPPPLRCWLLRACGPRAAQPVVRARRAGDLPG